MKKIKDIFYDLNDILVALIIVALAAFVILSNINSILDYPSAIAESIKTPDTKTPTHYADNPPITGDGQNTTSEGIAVSGGKSQNTTGSAVDKKGADGGKKVENYSVYINPGSTGSQIADLLISVGLFKERQEFYTAVTAAGADGKLKAGNFIIPSDSTPAEVVKIITK
jgi:hypothetical protein